MTTPFVRAKAQDTVDALDNVTSYLELSVKEEVAEFVMLLLRDVEKVMTRAVEEGQDPLVAYRAFLGKVDEYWRRAPA